MGIHNDIDVTTLLDRPLWQLTGREFCALTQYANKEIMSNTNMSGRKHCQGVAALAKEHGCSQSKIYEMKREGVLDESIVSRIGKPICFNVELARSLASEYSKKKNKD